MKIYKFTKNTVELSQYYKNIDSIHSIIILGNTCGLCGWFDMIEDEKWEEMVPRPNIDKTCDAAYENMDVLESLINNKAEIVVVCDSEDTKTYWETVYHYFCVLMDKEEIRNFKMIDSIKENKDYETVMKDIKTKVEKRNHKFDVGFINAPYDGTLHEKFESMMFDLCNDEIVWVGPSYWFYTKPTQKCTEELRENVKTHCTNVIDICGEDYFDADTKPFMCVTHVDLNKNPQILHNGNIYSNIPEVKDTMLSSMYELVSMLSSEDNVCNHIVDVNKYTEQDSCCINIPYMTGNDNTNPDKQPGFYSILNRELTKNKYSGITNIYNLRELNKNTNYAILVDNKNNAENIKNYLQTFFVRCALFFRKFTKHLISGSKTDLVPWFDFSDPMFAGSPEDIDVALFRKYGISQQIVDHILEKLPNYYNLDLTKYKNIQY